MFVIAHRGANRFAPQNTIESFRKAIEFKSDGIETDIQITKDGHLVLCHDSTVNRTSNGKGKISEFLLSDLRELDFGSWFGKKFRETKIPTIDDFLEFVKDSPLKILDIELKPRKDTEGFAQKILDKVDEYGLTDRLLISSFDINILNDVKRINPTVPVGILYPYPSDIVKRKLVSPFKFAIRNKIDYLLPHYSYVTEALIRKAHALDIKVAPWTVNKLETADRLIRWKADGLITDMPDVMLNKIESF